MTEQQLLSRIRGTADNLLTLPMSGRVRGGTLTNAVLWGGVYHETGLSFSTRTAETTQLRELCAAGYLAADGKTKSQGHRLTWRGIMATQPEDDDGLGVLANLATLAAMPEHDLGGGALGVEGFRLCPAAIAYVKTGKNADQYRDEIGTASVTLAPLLMMRWATLATDCSGMFWAARVTDEGRAAIATLPDTDPDASGTHFDFDAWEAGFDAADNYETKPPPTWTEGRVVWMLGTGSAWGAMDRYTAAKVNKEIETARAKATELLGG